MLLFRESIRGFFMLSKKKQREGTIHDALDPAPPPLPAFLPAIHIF